MKGARRPHIAFALIGFSSVPHDLATDDLAKAQACTQLIEKTGGQTHGGYIGRVPG